MQLPWEATLEATDNGVWAVQLCRDESVWEAELGSGSTDGVRPAVPTITSPRRL